MMARRLVEQVTVLDTNTTAVVKWWNRRKGHGFVIIQGGDYDGREAFVHYAHIDGEYVNLSDGEPVTVGQLVDVGKGPQARDVVIARRGMG